MDRPHGIESFCHDYTSKKSSAFALRRTTLPAGIVLLRAAYKYAIQTVGYSWELAGGNASGIHNGTTIEHNLCSSTDSNTFELVKATDFESPTPGTPRTIPENQTSGLHPSPNSSQHSSYQYSGYSQDPAYRNSLFPIGTQNPPTNNAVTQREESRSFLSQRQPTDSSLDQNYPQRYDSVPRNTTAPYAAGRPETDVSYNTYQDQSKLTGSQTGTEDRAGLAYDEEATSQKASGLERRRTYPSGTRSYDEKDGFIYYYDEYKRCIGKEPSRRESDPGPDPGLGDITTGLSQLGIGARDQRNREAMENYRVQSQANDSSRNRHPGRQRRLSSAQKSNLAPVREDKRPNPIYTDELDKRFILWTGKREQEFFVPGRVFATLWHEGAGGGGTNITGSYTMGPYNRAIFSKKRRMVVVKVFHGSSWCLPILTYNGQGVTKSGLSAEDVRHHAVIYMTGTTPQTQSDERGMVKRAIEVQPSSPDQKLKPMSRLNFGKIHTMEHNREAMDVGMVIQASMPYLISYFKTTYNEP